MPVPSAHILVVDDDVDTCENLRDILADCGYHVTVAHSGEEALPLVHREVFDLALLDFRMPGMDGLQLYREIRKLRAGTVAVIISAYAAGDTAEQALQAGVWHVLHKPVDFAALLPVIEAAAHQPLIMIVDDDPELCDNLWEILRDRGYRADIARSVAEANVQLAARPHGVVLIDMKLPGGSGGDVFRQLRQCDPDARVVLISGCRAECDDLIQRTLAEGADAVCYKPFEVPHLIETIDRLAASREPRA